MSRFSRFWYVGSPFTRYRRGERAAFDEVCKFTAQLCDHGIPCFSPIAHSYSIIQHCADYKPNDKTYAFWLGLDAHFMEASCGMLVCRMEGWDVSKGLTWEREWFNAQDKPVYYLNPDSAVHLMEPLLGRLQRAGG